MPNALADLFNAANARFRDGRFHEALALYDEALRLKPGQPRILLNRGQALRKLDRLDEAAAALADAAAREPEALEPLTALAEVLLQLRRPAALVEAMQRAVALRPDMAALHQSLGVAYRLDRRFDEAVAAFETAVRLDPAIRRSHIGAARLMLGDYANGWRDFETRGFDAAFVHRFGDIPRWTGEQAIAGKTVLVHAEQGLGDTLMFSRYIPLMAAAGARVLFAPQKPLRRLMAQLPARIVDLNDADLSPDLTVRTMSLPLAHRTTLETIPNATPYLAADPALVELWRTVVGGDGYRIGVAWQGSANAEQAGRSFDPAHLAPLAALPGVRLISLQKDDPANPPGRLAALGIETLARELDAGADAFVDTAAVMASLDLVITLDSAVAHLAGALGRPTWIALSRHSEWRWLIDRTDSPWNPAARLWRQTTMDDWTPVFAAMRDALAAARP